MSARTFIPWAAVLALVLGSQAHAQVERAGPAQRLSAALGGSLGDGMSEAGGVGHGKLTPGVPRQGRGDVYRRRVMLETLRLAGAPRQSK